MQDRGVLERGIAVRGHFWTVYNMMTADKYQTVVSTLIWDGKDVGYVHIPHHTLSSVDSERYHN